MTKEQEQQRVADRDTVRTEIGLVHVMPSLYQGGKLPEGSKARLPSAPAKHEVTSAPTEKSAPVVKRPLQKPVPPKSNPHKRRILLIVGGAVLLALILVVSIVLLMRPETSPAPEPSPVVTIPEPSPVMTTPEPVPDFRPEPEPMPEPFPKEPTPGRDTDSDGLSDVEERLYGSNVRLPDTDRDGFLDGNEVFHQYDPLTPNPATLLERGVVTRGLKERVMLLYPSIWQPTTAFETPNALDFSLEAPSGERITMTTSLVLETSTLQAELARMADVEEDPDVLEVEYSKSKAGYELAMEKDQLRATLIVDGLLVVLRYELGEKNTVDFVQTFQMIVNSVEEAPEVVDL